MNLVMQTTTTAPPFQIDIHYDFWPAIIGTIIAVVVVLAALAFAVAVVIHRQNRSVPEGSGL